VAPALAGSLCRRRRKKARREPRRTEVVDLREAHADKRSHSLFGSNDVSQGSPIAAAVAAPRSGTVYVKSIRTTTVSIVLEGVVQYARLILATTNPPQPLLQVSMSLIRRTATPRCRRWTPRSAAPVRASAGAAEC